MQALVLLGVREEVDLKFLSLSFVSLCLEKEAGYTCIVSCHEGKWRHPWSSIDSNSLKYDCKNFKTEFNFDEEKKTPQTHHTVNLLSETDVHISLGLIFNYINALKVNLLQWNLSPKFVGTLGGTFVSPNSDRRPYGYGWLLSLKRRANHTQIRG